MAIPIGLFIIIVGLFVALIFIPSKVQNNGNTLGQTVVATSTIVTSTSTSGATSSIISNATSSVGGSTSTKPVFKNDSGIRGTITVGPMCPVQTEADPNCAPRPYPTSLTVYVENSSTVAAMAAPDSYGSYAIVLPPGKYLIVPRGGDPLPRCAPVTVTVAARVFTNQDLSCDSGIR